MSSAGTTLPGMTWRSSKPPTYVTAPAFKNQDGNKIEKNPNLTASRPAATYDPDRPGGTIFQRRTFNTFKKKDQSDINKRNKRASNGDKAKQSVRFSDLEPEGEREVVTTNAGGLVIKTTKPYETLIAERDALMETESAYRRRIKQLEEENQQILLDYDGIYKENNLLRDKIDKGDDNNIESFQRVYDDRQILREAETAYKRRILQLENDAQGMLKNFESLYKENKALRDKGKKLEDRLNAVDRLDDVKKMNELEKKTKHLERTIRTMGYESEEQTKVKHEIENKMYKLREDVSELNKRNLLLERENEGYKKGFMALGKNGDNRWIDDARLKTRRQEEEERILREEHKDFKSQIEKITKQNHTLEKVNVEVKTRNDILENDKIDFERQIFELAKEARNRTPTATKRKEIAASELKNKKMEELTQSVDDLRNENAKLKTKTEILNKEKEMFELRIEQVAKQPRETASSIRRKMETEREIRDLNTHVENFKEKVKRLDVENTDLKDEMKRIEIEAKANKQAANAIASGQANHADSEIKDLNAKIITLNDDIKSLTEENLKFKADYNALQDKLQDQIDKLAKENEEILNEKEALQNNMAQSNTENTDKLQELQDEANAVQVELKLLTPKYDDLVKSHEELKKETDSLKQILEEKKNEVEEMKDIMRDGKDVYNDLKRSQRECANLRSEIEDMNNKFKGERIKMETDLEELLKNQEFMNTALAEHKVRLDMLQQEKNEVKADNTKLVKANERQTKTIIDLQADKERISGEGSSTTKALKEEVETMTKHIKKTETELVQAKQELEVVKNEKENQVNKLLKQMEKLKAEREIETRRLKEQSDDLRSEVGRLKVFEERIANMEKDLKEFIIKLSESEDRNKALTDQRLSSLNQVVTEMKSENLANRIRAAEREENELEKHKMELEIKQDAITEIRKLKEENQRLVALLEDKRSAEEAQDEWTKKRNKFNEIVAQNKRLALENKRMLSLYEQSKSDTLKQELQAKTEKLKLVESQFQMFSIENAKLKKTIEEKDSKIRTVEAKVDHSKKLLNDNKKITLENNRLRGELSQKDNIISQLKELETTKAKYMDASANNQRLYDENRRLRDNIEKSNDYKGAFQKIKDQEKLTAQQQAKYIEENTLLKNTLQIRERELNRDLELQKDRANNLQARNKRVVDELARVNLEVAKKDDIIIKLRVIENTSEKYKDIHVNLNRLYEENQRLRNIIESMGGTRWKNNFMNTKAMSANVYKDKRSEQPVAVYVKTNTETEEVQPAGKKEKLLKSRDTNKEKENTVVSTTSGNQSEDDHIGKKMKIKPLTKLPEINTENSNLTFGMSYRQLHRKSRLLKEEKVTASLNEEISNVAAKLLKSERETKEQIHEKKKLQDECDALKSEVTQLRKKLQVQEIGNQLDHSTQLHNQNKRLQAENQRLREETGNPTVNNQNTNGVTKAHYMESKNAYTKLKDVHEQLTDALVDNRRLLDENYRLQAALDHVQQADVVGSRFKDQKVVGKIIDGFKDAKSKNWASRTDNSRAKKDAIKKQQNETDDNKLLKLEDIN